MRETGERGPEQLSAVQALPKVMKERTLALGAELAAEVKQQAGKRIRQTFASFKLDTPRFSAHVGGADSLRPEYLRHDRERRYSLMAVSLYDDGSPFMREEDMGDFAAYRTIYHIVCQPNTRPFLVHEDRLVNADYSIWMSIRNYLRSVHQGRQPALYTLDDQEAGQLLGVLTDPQLAGYVDTEEALLAIEPRSAKSV